MGNATGAQRKYLVNEVDPTTWRLEHVEAIRERYLAGNHDFGLEKEQLREIVQSVLPHETGDVVEQVLWTSSSRCSGRDSPSTTRAAR